jgi:hypothetical protein
MLVDKNSRIELKKLEKKKIAYFLKNLVVVVYKPAYKQNICTLLKLVDTPTINAIKSVKLVIVILTPDFFNADDIRSLVVNSEFVYINDE